MALHFERIVYCSNKWKVSAERAVVLSIQAQWGHWWVGAAVSTSPLALLLEPREMVEAMLTGLHRPHEDSLLLFVCLFDFEKQFHVA